jgi:hypothetical protein
MARFRVRGIVDPDPKLNILITRFLVYLGGCWKAILASSPAVLWARMGCPRPRYTLLFFPTQSYWKRLQGLFSTFFISVPDL